MLGILFRLTQTGCLAFKGVIRSLTTQEVSTALRPFYFSVHPDLFGQYPQQREVNEDSLKRLSEYMTSLQMTGHARPTKVVFYVRLQTESDTFKEVLFGGQTLKEIQNIIENCKFVRRRLEARPEPLKPTQIPDYSWQTLGRMKQVSIELNSKTLHETVLTVLKSCGLSLDYLNNIPIHPMVNSTTRPIKWHSSFYTATGKEDPLQQLHKQTPQVTLSSWLQVNIEQSRRQVNSIHHVQEDIKRLCEVLHAALGLQEIRWDNVWGISHFRGCLKSFYRLYAEHPEVFDKALKDRKLVFSNMTGVSRLGEIVLSSEDVPTSWMKLLLSVQGYNAVLERLPHMERKLSNLLNGIRIVRHERSHSHVMAEEYELLLNRLLNSLRRCQDHVQQVFANADLSGLEMVVEGENGPLTLSSMGSFLIPASVPGTLVVDFINDEKEEAARILKIITRCLKMEEETIEFCRGVLELKEISKDGSVSAQQMISCCQRLAANHWHYSQILSQAQLRVSHYYSVMQDGQICIPWDWVGED